MGSTEPEPQVPNQNSLAIGADRCQVSTDQKVWGSNPYGRARVSARSDRVHVSRGSHSGMAAAAEGNANHAAVDRRRLLPTAPNGPPGMRSGAIIVPKQIQQPPTA